MRSSFLIACAAEGSLSILALILALVFSFPLENYFEWDPGHLPLGMLTSLPLLGLFFFTLTSKWQPLVNIRVFLETTVRPFFSGCSLLELLVISLLAGFGEELLFRVLIQGVLVLKFGFWPGLIVASLLFGACHWITKTYAAIATLIGVYLGVLYHYSGNGLIPMTTHALYDFIALSVFLHQEKWGIGSGLKGENGLE